MSIQPPQFVTSSLRHSTHGEEICRILASAIHGADAGAAIQMHVHLDGEQLLVDGKNYNLARYERLLIIAAGKAAIPMAASLSEILGERLTGGLVISKKGSLRSEYTTNRGFLPVIEACHPIPGQSNLEASASLTSLLVGLNPADLVFCLLSGGASALLMKPSPGVTLEGLQVTTQALLACGAGIAEINTIRKHLDDFKGGRLAKLFFPATAVTLILSDVMGDCIDQIASGPTVADPTTYKDAWSILNKYQLMDHIPPAIRDYVQAGMENKVPETIKPGDPILTSLQHVIIGNNTQAVLAAVQAAQKLGFFTQILDTSLHGEASVEGAALVERAKSILKTLPCRPACLFAGGETTVHIRGTGKGGRNQELALGAVRPIAGNDPLILVSLATDGDDGPTDAAGAVITNQTYPRGLSMGLDPKVYLANNDAYHYFERLGDLIKTGPTLTNVNDLALIFTA